MNRRITTGHQTHRSGVLPLEKLITKIEPLEKLPDVCKQLHGNPEAMKVLIDCNS